MAFFAFWEAGMRVSPFEFEAPSPAPPPGQDGLEAGPAAPAPSDGEASEPERLADSLDEPGYGHGV